MEERDINQFLKLSPFSMFLDLNGGCHAYHYAFSVCPKCATCFQPPEVFRTGAARGNFFIS